MRLGQRRSHSPLQILGWIIRDRFGGSARRSCSSSKAQPSLRADVTVSTVSGGDDKSESRVRRRGNWVPTVGLTLLIVGSTFVQAAWGWRAAAPWIIPDEIAYTELARSIALGDLPAIRGVTTFSWAPVYPVVISPAWLLSSDLESAYRIALTLNAFVMSLASVPAYLLARLFVGCRSAFFVAFATVLVPSMAYTQVVMTENAFYPMFLLALLLVARSLDRPSYGRQAAAIAGLGVLVLTRVQGVALVAAYAISVFAFAALLELPLRRRFVRAFAPSAVLVACVGLLVPFVSVVRGRGIAGWLGVYSTAFDGLRVGEIPRWFLVQGAELTLYLAVAPVAATVIVISGGLSWRVDRRVRLFIALALPALGALFVTISLVSASVDVDGHENINERYLFYLVPLFLIGLAIWIDRGLSRPRPAAWVLVLVLSVAPALLPVERLAYNAGFQSLALIPWIVSPLSGIALALAIAGFALAAGLLWMTVASDRAGRIWVLVVVWFVAVMSSAHLSMMASTTASRSYLGGEPRWVDEAVPAGEFAVALWDERPLRGGPLASDYRRLVLTEVFNERVGVVYRLGPPTYYEHLLPTRPARVLSTGHIVEANGRRITAKYVLTSCRLGFAGHEIARNADRGSVLYRADSSLRLGGRSRCDSGARRSSSSSANAR